MLLTPDSVRGIARQMRTRIALAPTPSAAAELGRAASRWDEVAIRLEIYAAAWPEKFLSEPGAGRVDLPS